jgi:hypothetical protein
MKNVNLLGVSGASEGDFVALSVKRLARRKPMARYKSEENG